MARVVRFLKTSLHNSYTASRNGRSGVILYKAAYDQSLLTMTYSMALLHSLIVGLEMKYRCRQKEGVALRHCYLKGATGRSFSSFKCKQSQLRLWHTFRTHAVATSLV
jgi:hypothetical protein